MIIDICFTERCGKNKYGWLDPLNIIDVEFSCHTEQALNYIYSQFGLYYHKNIKYYISYELSKQIRLSLPKTGLVSMLGIKLYEDDK